MVWGRHNGRALTRLGTMVHRISARVRGAAATDAIKLTKWLLWRKLWLVVVPRIETRRRCHSRQVQSIFQSWRRESSNETQPRLAGRRPKLFEPPVTDLVVKNNACRASRSSS